MIERICFSIDEKLMPTGHLELCNKINEIIDVVNSMSSSAQKDLPLFLNIRFAPDVSNDVKHDYAMALRKVLTNNGLDDALILISTNGIVEFEVINGKIVNIEQQDLKTFLESKGMI